MKILNQYVLRAFIGPFAFNTFLFLFMFIIVDVINNLDDFMKNEVAFGVIISYYLNMIPMMFSHLIPASMLISTLYALGALNKNNEIAAMKATGVSGVQILFPVLYLGLIVSLGLLAVNETITPRASVISSSIKQGIISKKGGKNRQRSIENVALISEGNRMIYARELLPTTQSLFDVVVLDHDRDLALESKTTAQRAVYNGTTWTLYEVREYNVDKEGNILQKPLITDKKETSISEPPEEFLKQYTRPEFMSSRQLKSYIDNTQITGFKLSSRLLMELHQKFAQPFMCFIMLLVAAPLALKTRREGAMVSLGMGLFVIASYYAVLGFSSALGKGGALPPIFAAWLPNALFLTAGLYLLKRNI